MAGMDEWGDMAVCGHSGRTDGL